MKIKITFIICIIVLLFTVAHAEMDNPLKQGMPNTVMLSNGEVIYDLSGEWHAIYDHKDYGTNKDMVYITQEGNKFVGIKLMGNQFIPGGTATIRGKLEQNRFKSVHGYTSANGWTLSKGEISNNGKKIVIETPVPSYNYTAVITLTRE